MTTQIENGNFKKAYRVMNQTGRSWNEDKEIFVVVARALGKEVSDSVFDKRNQRSLFRQKFWVNLKAAIWFMIESAKLKAIENTGPIVGREVTYMGEKGILTNFSGSVVSFQPHGGGRKVTSLSLLNFFFDAYALLPGDDIEGKDWWDARVKRISDAMKEG